MVENINHNSLRRFKYLQLPHIICSTSWLCYLQNVLNHFDFTAELYDLISQQQKTPNIIFLI